MESNSDRASADAAASLGALARDRLALGAHTAARPWYHLTFAALAALIVAVPGIAAAVGDPIAGSSVAAVLFALCAVALALLTVVETRRSGVVVAFRMPGALSVVITILIGLVLVVLLLASVALVLVGLAPWVIATTAVCFIGTLAGSLLFARVYRSELVRAV